jgi:TolA-binding protein
VTPHLPGSPPTPLLRGGATGLEDQATADLLSRLAPPTDDDLAIQRNWRRLASMSPMRRSRRGALLAAAMSGLVAIAVGWAVAPHRQPAPSGNMELVAASGGVFFSRPAEDWQVGSCGQTLDEGQRLRTDQSASALVLEKGTAAVLVQPDSDVAFEKLRSGNVLRLANGSILAQVAKRAPNNPFVVLTDRYSVRVVGTLFSVTQGPGERVEVSVREGTVVITEGAREIARVTAGMHWTSGASASVPDATADDAASLVRAALRGNDVTGSQRQLDRMLAATPSERATKAEDASGAAATRAASPLRSGKLPAPAVAAAAPVHRVAPVPAIAPAPVQTPQPAESAVPAAPSEPHPARAVDPEDAYDDALALEAAGDAHSAAEALAVVADRDPRHAELALYGLGRLKLRRLGDPAGALAAFERYRREYSKGSLLPEVDLSIFEIEASLGRREEALAESERYLSTYRDVGRTDEVRLLRGNLIRDGGDCVGALREYSLVISPTVGDEATYNIAFCQRKLGDRRAATATLRDYLKRYPSGAHRAEAQRAVDGSDGRF